MTRLPFKKRPRSALALAVLAASMSLIAATALVAAPAAPVNPVIHLATTTSTEQSGLLGWLLPRFQKETGYEVHVVAVGSGQAIKLGEDGNADALLVHSPAAEKAFVDAGFGVDRKDVMYNDFVILGPAIDPAAIKGSASAVEAFRKIASSASPFISRGDKSGTDVKEKDLWKAAGIVPAGSWYKEIGQGMSQAIMMANETGAYTLADRGTWLSMLGKTSLVVLFEGDRTLFNPYGIIAVNQAKWPSVNYAGAKAMIAWITGPTGRSLIEAFKVSGQQLFFPYK
jgi:tungstate transport system substrate-binding protein